MDVVADTSMGLLKAFAFLLQQQRRAPKPKFEYQPAGNAVHARTMLKPQQRAAVNSTLAGLQALDPADPADSDRIKQLIDTLTKLPVKFVPVRRETRIDRSKSYPYGSKRQGY
jgi:hypothetical protein